MSPGYQRNTINNTLSIFFPLKPSWENAWLTVPRQWY